VPGADRPPGMHDAVHTWHTSELDRAAAAAADPTLALVRCSGTWSDYNPLGLSMSAVSEPPAP